MSQRSKEVIFFMLTNRSHFFIFRIFILFAVNDNIVYMKSAQHTVYNQFASANAIIIL